ncbi:MAG: hypothetical protein IKJ25_00025 [Clostridia bacterium]|nr:hypothetical protein [Clostridia bacterium]
MKRNFKLLVAVVVLAALVMTLASCDVINGLVDKINPKPHEHTYSADWSSDETNHWHAATCQDTEECGSQKSDVAPHTYAEGKCSVCGAADPNYTPVCTEHAYGAPVETKAPTCTEKGEKTLTCTVCGETMTQEVAPNGHTEVELEGKAPTCTETGLSKGKKCSVCDTILTAQVEIPATNHNYVEGVCSACNAEDPNYNGPKTYVLDANDLENKAKIDEDGFHSSVVAGSKDFFTIYLSKKTEIKENKKTFEDGYVSTKRIGWNTKTVVSEDEIASAIEMNITGTATVKIWWVSGGYYTVDDVEVPRQIAIYDENGNIVTKTNVPDPGKTDSDTDGVKNNLFISELTISKPGKYYLGNVGNSNYYFKVEVVETPIEKHTTTVTTTDNNCWEDKVTFTATAEGEYTFYLPVGLGAWDADGCDNFINAPFVDPYDPHNYNPEGEHKFTIGLEANETYEFYISAAEKKDWQIEWTYVACDVEDDAPAGDDEGGNEDVVLDGVYTGHAMYQSNITVTFNPMLGVVTFAQGDNSLMCLFEVKDGEVVLYKNDGSGEEWNPMFYAITLENGAPVAATYNGNNFTLVAGADSGDDDDDDQTTGPLDTENSTLVIGSNTVNVTDADLEAEAIDYTIVVTAEGTFAFSSNDLAAIVYDANGMQVGRGSVYLTKGTYTVSVVTAYLSAAGEYTLTVEYTAPSTVEEADGSESNPYVWETLPESVTIDSDTINMVYYLFTATEAGNITITWPTADSWANWFEMDGTNTTATNGTSNEQTTMVVPVEAGKTYRIGLGTYYVAGEFTLTVSFGEGTTEEDKGATYVGTDDWGNSPLTVVITDTTVTFNYNNPMTGPSSATYTYAMVDGAMVLYNEDGSTVNPLGGLVNVDENGTPVSAAYNGTDYTLAPAGAEDDDNTGDDDDDTEEVEIKGAIYADEENTLAVTADDITAGKFYVSFYPWNDGEWDFISNNLFVNSVTTEAGVEIEINDNYYYVLESMTTYIIEISTEYIGNAGDYTITPEYQYPQGHQNNPFWYTLDETTTANCAGGYTPVWYQFYANATGTLTLSTELDNITLMIAGYPGYEVTNMSQDENYNTVYAKTLSLDVVQGRKYYIAVAAYESETAIDVAFTASITEGEITTDGTINVPHNVVIGSNTASIAAWDNVWFMYKADANGTLTLSTESDNYAWYALTDLSKGGYASTGEISVHLETGAILYLYVETADWSAGEVPFTASFKADPTEAWFEGNLVVDGSAANEIVIEENTYAGFQVSGVVGQITITWDNTNAVVKVNEEAIENGAVISVANPYWGPYFQISLPEYAAGTVNLTITPYEAPSQEAVVGDNTVSANGSTATPVKFTATEANTYVITIGANAVVEYDYMSYFEDETIKITLGAGESVNFNVYTEDRSEADVVVNIAIAPPSVSGEYRYVYSEDWKHRWVLILEDDGTGTIAEQTYDADAWTWNDVSSHDLSYTFVKGETNYSITIDFADGCSAVDGTYVTGPVDDTTGITSVVIGESTFDFFIYE